MALREEFEKQGNWLFQWRSYLPFVAIPLVAYGLTQSEGLERHFGGALEIPWKIFSISVSVVGFLIRCVAVGWSAKGTSGRNTHGQVAESVNTKGIYSVVRHPLYLGNFCLTLGFILFTQVAWLIVISILLFWLYYERIMYAEEAFLRKKFGSVYTDWADRTPVFIPDFRKWKSPDYPFSFKKVLKREPSGFFGLISAFVVLNFLTKLLGSHQVEVRSISLLFLGVGFAVYMILRYLSKKTKILEPHN